MWLLSAHPACRKTTKIQPRFSAAEKNPSFMKTPEFGVRDAWFQTMLKQSWRR